MEDEEERILEKGWLEKYYLRQKFLEEIVNKRKSIFDDIERNLALINSRIGSNILLKSSSTLTDDFEVPPPPPDDE